MNKKSSEPTTEEKGKQHLSKNWHGRKLACRKCGLSLNLNRFRFVDLDYGYAHKKCKR